MVAPSAQLAQHSTAAAGLGTPRWEALWDTQPQHCEEVCLAFPSRAIEYDRCLGTLFPARSLPCHSGVLPHNLNPKRIMPLLYLGFPRGDGNRHLQHWCLQATTTSFLCRLTPCCAPHGTCRTRSQHLHTGRTRNDNRSHQQSMRWRNSTTCASTSRMHSSPEEPWALVLLLGCDRLLWSVLFSSMLGISCTHCASFLRLLGWRACQSAHGALRLSSFMYCDR